MRSQVIRIRNLPRDRVVSKRINVKPNLFLGLLIAAGVVILVARLYYSIVGLSMVILGLFAMIVMPDHVLCEFTQDYMILYNLPEKNRCSLVYYEDIVSWHYEWHASMDLLVIMLVDGTTEALEMYSRYPVRAYMEMFAPGKEKKGSGKRGKK